MAIKKDYLVKKRNVLNEIRSNNMTLQELRFFSVYLAKINPKDSNTRAVRFSLFDFQKIMELGRLNIDYLKNVTDSLLCKVINVPLETGGYTGFQIFKECTVTQDSLGEWYVEIDAHDKALPLLFEFKNRYFSYELWNALRLRSSNQLRMYEILKQYEFVGERIISVDDLKELMGINKKEYLLFNNFKTKVLEVCQKALAENTDIKFTYEPSGKRGNGGKIINLKFTITKNTSYVDQLTLDEFIHQQVKEDVNEVSFKFSNQILEFLADACNNEFAEDEMQLLFDMIVKIIPFGSASNVELERYDYLKRKYDEMNLRKPQKSRFGYLKSIIKVDFSEA